VVLKHKTGKSLSETLCILFSETNINLGALGNDAEANISTAEGKSNRIMKRLHNDKLHILYATNITGVEN
jgi:hypothetical protein